MDQQRRVSDEDLCFRRARTQKHGLPRGYALATVRIGWIHVRLTHICARLPSIYFPSSLESPRKTKREENEVYIHKYTTKFTQNREKTVTIEEIHLHQTADTGNIVLMLLIHAFLPWMCYPKRGRSTPWACQCHCKSNNTWPATSRSRSFLAHPLEIPRYSPVQNRLSASAPLQHLICWTTEDIQISKLALS